MARQVFRSPVAVVVWWIWVLFAVANLIDIAVQGRDRSSLVAAVILLVVTGAMWAGAQRPRLIADDSGLTIVNPLREHRVGWTTVAGIDATDLLRVRCEWPEEPGGPAGRKTIYAWAVGTSRRRQAIASMRAERRTRSRRGASIGVFGGWDGGFGAPASTPDGGANGSAARNVPDPGDTDKIMAALTERVNEARAAANDTPAARPVSTWCLPAFAAIAVPVLALLIVIAV